MTGHDHDASVAMYGECPTCALDARDHAIAQAEHAAPISWLRQAHQVVAELAATGEPFTTDDVWARLPQPPEPRALGAVMQAAADRGAIAPTGRTVRSRRTACHARPLCEWAGPQAGYKAGDTHRG